MWRDYGGVSRESIDKARRLSYRFPMTRSFINLRRSHVPLGILVPALFFAALGGCESSTAPVITTWEGTLAPRPPHFMSGRVAAVTQFGRTIVSIQVEEGEPGVTYGWRLNAGTCQQEGEIQGGTASYPPLNPGETGTASGETTLAEVFRDGDTYAARVFLSTGGSEEMVACGELNRT